jgi:hypothetical protein
MAKMEVRNIVFQFKGARNYIQGPDMFNAMTEGYPAMALSNIHFSAHDFVLVPECRLYLADSEEELNSICDIRARCRFDADGFTRWLALTPEDGDTASAGRCEYNEDRVVSLCRVEGDGITLAKKSPFTFIETLVSMNKHLQQRMFPDMPGKWLFTRIDLTVGCDARENLALRFRHNLNYRLTKSDILVAGRKVGDLYFSLVKS